ncbi:MAG: carbohydrate ABC transporter permease [Clostridiales bacterium]|jgi:multiple sugar transport system permease protein|nr:carbohydrate ABC transporter permease [Clostridiales bacterium]
MNKRIRDKWKLAIYRNKQSGGYLLKKTITSKIYSFLRAALLFGVCFLIIQPLLNKVSMSFMLEKDLYDPTIIVVPRNFTTENYKLVSYLIDYWKSLRNSLIFSVIISVLQVASATVVGYGFARFNFPLKKFWFACVILVILVPPQTILSSLYLNFRFFDIFGIVEFFTGQTINLLKSPLPYMFMSLTSMGLKGGLYIFLIRQYYRGVPKELEEAAYVDGCGNFATFIRIMLPDAKPIITSCFLFAFVWQWTDSFFSTMFLGDISLLSRKLTAISQLLGDYLNGIGGGVRASIAYGQMMISTGMIMAIIPLLLIYIVSQRAFVESLSQTGIKM